MAAFPAFLCSRERLVLSREPVYKLHAASVSSDQPTPHHLQRYLPPASVFHATESRFNDDFTQLAVKVTSSFGMTGWINASFHKTLIEVEDPRDRLRNAIYVQNVAAKTGKWAGELPVRAIPSLQAPRLYSVENFRIVRALERKLVKDQVWVRIEPFQHLEEEKATANDADSKSDAESDSSAASRNSEAKGKSAGEHKQEPNPHEQAWIIERNASTAQRVVVPWGSASIEDAPISDDQERFYRNLYSRRPLPLRSDPTLQSSVVGHLSPGTVFVSAKRVLNDKGQMWIRVALSDAKRAGKVADASSAAESSEEAAIEYGYAIQSNAKTNTCMVQEITAPSKMDPKRFYQIVLPSDASSTNKNTGGKGEESSSQSDIDDGIAARTEASSSEGKDLFYVKNGAIVSAIGSVFNAKEQRVWLQVLASDIDPAMRVKQERWALSSEDQALSVVYLPLCDPSLDSLRPADTILKSINCELTKIDDPRAGGHGFKAAATRVVFSGRASKLFSSHLMRPSTIDLPTFSKKTPDSAVDSDGPAAAAAGENQERTQSLREEIAKWQQETTTRAGAVYANVNWALVYAASCVVQPFASCMAAKTARERYAQLYQDDDDDDDDEALPHHEVNV